MKQRGLEELRIWMNSVEAERLEFKEAKNNFDLEKLVQYCVAIANEGGGVLILGVTDQAPRRVVGSRAFEDLERTKSQLVDRLKLRVDADVIAHPDGRVVAFTIPPRPLGVPLHHNGAYLMRAGESLVAMTPDRLRRIFDEVVPDHSAEIVPAATMADLEPGAIEKFRELWRRKSGNEQIDRMGPDQLLADAELAPDGRISVAALVLLGTRAGLGRHLAQAELVAEYRSADASIAPQQRLEFREGFLRYFDELLRFVQARNEVQQFRDGLIIRDIPTINEVAAREAILNAVSHRDYRHAGSIFLRLYPRRIEIVSPGGFPPGVTAENILWRQAPRNRRLAEALAKCGFVERSGQGADRMFEESIKEGKPRPDFAGTDDYQVALTLRGDVQDVAFLRFLERVGQETLVSFSTTDLVVLDIVHRGEEVPKNLASRVPQLVEKGVLERYGRGRKKLMLSRRFYAFVGRKGEYTRRRGLDKPHSKMLLLQHLEQFETATIQEFEQALPGHVRHAIHRLLRELKREGKVVMLGSKRGSRWTLKK
ncbi:putative transcriptional regulator [Anaeromyxobacter dehalogenans 2CP-1]|uniref:Transcriptional regulator n=2 Tax=Anaeromyxobacter dehalogenans TaxID=161493 RepID=B8JA39_ANAD2|nr:putative transcriptional regulator [Anaeromyxobacter dehalogenans 2CP-1]